MGGSPTKSSEIMDLRDITAGYIMAVNIMAGNIAALYIMAGNTTVGYIMAVYITTKSIRKGVLRQGILRQCILRQGMLLQGISRQGISRQVILLHLGNRNGHVSTSVRWKPFLTIALESSRRALQPVTHMHC